MEETMDLGLEGKVALLTGTASQIGFGAAISLALAKEGCDIISTDKELEGAERTAADVKTLGRKAIALKADVTNGAEVDKMVKAALKEFGRIDISLNCAGAALARGPFHELEYGDWEKDINLNLYGTMNCVRAILPGMIECKYGKIINFSSVSGRIAGPAGGIPYAVSKGGVIILTMGVAKYVGESGINVNAIAPGPVVTNFPGRETPFTPSELEERRKQAEQQAERIPTRRPTTVPDIVNMAVFLASDVSKQITGQTISVDGGLFMF